MMISRLSFFFMVAVATTATYGDSSCVYKYKGYTIDLSKYLNFPVEKIADKTDDFSYNVDLCNAVKCTKTSGCACQIGGTQDKEPFDFSLGKLSTAQWNVIELDPLHFTVTYTDGDPSDAENGKKNVKRSAVFEFQYSDTPSTDEIKMTKQDPNTLIYSFGVTGGNITAATCTSGGGGSKVGIAGLVIIIIALVALIIYFIAGSVYMYNIRGARGPEVIPNHYFWKELPILVKDGFVFTFGPLFRLSRRGSSYDRI